MTIQEIIKKLDEAEAAALVATYKSTCMRLYEERRLEETIENVVKGLHYLIEEIERLMERRFEKAGEEAVDVPKTTKELLHALVWGHANITNQLL